MKQSIPHHLSLDTVRSATKKALDVYQEKFSEYEAKAVWPSENHADVSFVALGKKLEGTIDLNDKTIDLELDVPFLMKPFQGKAMDIIQKEITKWLGKAERGELEEGSSADTEEKSDD